MLEPGPAVIFVGAFFGVFAGGEDAALHRLFEPGGFVFLQGMEVVEAAEEQQIGDLLDDFERVGDAAGPEGVPDAVNLVADVASEHGSETAWNEEQDASGRQEETIGCAHALARRLSICPPQGHALSHLILAFEPIGSSNRPGSI